MPTITWTVQTENSQHTIRLFHQTNLGKRQIWVDDGLVDEGRRIADSGTMHYFQLDGKEYELAIATNNIRFFYFLVQDGCPLLSDQDIQKGKTVEELLKNQYLRQRIFFGELGQTLGLKYYPCKGQNPGLQHRLIGLINGYIILIENAVRTQKPRQGTLVLVKHAEPPTPDAWERFLSNPRLANLLGKYKPKDLVYLDPNTSIIFLPGVKNETPAELGGRIRDLIQAVTEYARPMPDNFCEDPHCRQPFVTERQIVVFNNQTTSVFCPESIAAIPEIVSKAEEEHKQAPDRLLRGTLAGAGLALLGALLWPLVDLIWHRGSHLVPFTTILYIPIVMLRVGTKFSWRSVLIQLALSSLSILLGFLGGIFTTLVKNGAAPGLETLFEAWFRLISNPQRLYGLGAMVLFVSSWPIFEIWTRNRRAKSEAFHPHVEVLPGKY